VKPSDRGSTSAYLNAQYAFARAAASQTAASVAAIEAEAAGIAQGCPSSLAGAPHRRQFDELGEETTAAVLFAGSKPDANATHAFVNTIAHLRWSNHKIAGLMRMLAAEERATIALALPDVCADIEAWVKSDYHTLAQGTQLFLKQTEAIEKTVGPKKESLNDAILRMLKPYESARDRRLARQTKHLYEIVGRRILEGFSAAMKNLGHALGVKSS
jgi:hypothetical protein